MTNPLQVASNSDFSLTALDASFGSLPADTHQVIAVINNRQAGGVVQVTNVTDNQGNTYVRAFGVTSPGSFSGNQEVWWCQDIGSPTGTFTVEADFSSAFASCSITIMECSGLVHVDQTAYGFLLADGSPGPGTALTLTTLAPDIDSTDFMVSSLFLGSSGSALGVTTPSGWTSAFAQDPGNPDVGVATKTQTSNASADTVAWGWTSSGDATGILVSFSASQPTLPHLVQVSPLLQAQGIASPATCTTPLYKVQAGNTLLASFSYQDNNSVLNTPSSVSDGASYTQDAWKTTSGHSGVGVYSLWNVSSGTHTLAVGSTSGSYNVVGSLFEVWGLPTTNSLDITASANGSSTGPITATTAALSASHDFVMASGMFENYATLACPSGWLEVSTTTDGSGDVQVNPATTTAILVPSATTALSPSFGTQGTSHRWAVAVAAYKSISTGAALAGAAGAASSASGALSTAIKLAGAATAAVTASGALDAYASVTLAAPLYTGIGGVLDPNFWLDAAPVVGNTLFYDPTHISIANNGSISSDSNNCSALVQFNNGSGWAVGLIVIVPTMVGYVDIVTAVSASLSTAIQLSGNAVAQVAVTGKLVSASILGGNAVAVTAAAAALTTAIKLAGSAVESAAATGSLSSGTLLSGAATALVSAAANLSTQIKLAGQAIVTTAVSAALSAQIKLSGAAVDTTSASGQLSAGIQLAGNVAVVSAASGAMSTAIRMAGAANALLAAVGALSTQILLSGNAQVNSVAHGALIQSIAGAAIAVTTATGSLVTAIRLQGNVNALVTSTGQMGSGVQLAGNAAVNSVSTALLFDVVTHGFVFTVPREDDNAGTNGTVPTFVHFLRAGDVCFMGLNWADWLALRWQASEGVSAGLAVRPTSDNGFQSLCTQQGTTGGFEPRWPAQNGATVSDGSAQWTQEAVDDESLSTRIVGMQWNASPGLAAYGADIIDQTGFVVIDAADSVPGTTYMLVGTATMADGQKKTGSIQITVT